MKELLETRRFNADDDRALAYAITEGDDAGQFYYELYLGDSDTPIIEGVQNTHSNAIHRAINCYDAADEFCSDTIDYMILRHHRGRCDILHTEGIETAITVADALGGNVEIYVNNGAVYQPGEPETDGKRLEEIIAIVKARTFRQQIINAHNRYKIDDELRIG